MKRNSFLAGAGSVMGIAGNYFGFSVGGIKTDMKAIRADWIAIGNDFNVAMAKINGRT
jgi:hypothetical protein